MPNKNDKYDEYIEKLFCVQSGAAEVFETSIVRGEVREDFVIHELRKQFDHLKIMKGELTNGEKNTGQTDVIICNSGVRTRRIGDQVLINILNCEVVLEVKTTATGTDFRELNSKAVLIRQLENTARTKTGLFCYNLGMTKQNFLKRFGFCYDEEIKSYIRDESLTYSYPHIDFVLCLDEEIEIVKKSEDIKKFFLLRDEQNVFQLFLDPPVSKFFFKLLEGIN